MAVRALTRVEAGIYVGLSSDTKPTDVSIMARFYETDTQDWFIFDGISWTADLGMPVRPSNTPGGDISNNVQVVEQGQFDYETVAASQSDQVLGVTGAAGDFLHKLICVITTSTGSLVQIKDGSGSAITVLPTGLAAPGFYQIELNISSTSGAWKITTGANVAVLVIGRFTA